MALSKMAVLLCCVSFRLTVTHAECHFMLSIIMLSIMEQLTMLSITKISRHSSLKPSDQAEPYQGFKIFFLKII